MILFSTNTNYDVLYAISFLQSGKNFVASKERACATNNRGNTS